MPPKKSAQPLTEANDIDAPLRPKELKIYEAAARIFYEKGYAASTNQDIADVVGMLKGSLYYYIETKDDLLYGVIMMAYKPLRRHLAISRELEADELERLRFFVAGHTRLIIDHLMPVAVLERDLRSLSEQRTVEIVQWRDEYEAYLRDLLRAGQEGGVVRRTLDVQMASILMFTQMHSLHTWYRPTGPRTAVEIADIITDFVLHGVVA